MLKMSVRGLAKSTTEIGLSELFSRFGTVHSIKLAKDLYTGQCKGFAEVKMEGHEARSAIQELNLKEIDGSTLRVDVDKGLRNPGRGKHRR